MALATHTPLPHGYFDAQERRDTRRVLEALPAGHPAHTAFRMGVSPLELANIIGSEYPELVKRLKSIYLDAHHRILRRHGGGSRRR